MNRPDKRQDRARAPKRYCKRGHRRDLVRSGQLRCRECERLAWRRQSERRRQERLAARRARISARAIPSKEVRVWAAGHFEGEGTITITSGGARGVPRPLVTLTSTDTAVIDFFQANWPGLLRSHKPKSKNGLAREAFVWALTSCDAIEGFLLDMAAHWRTDRVQEKADLLLEDVRMRKEHRRTDEMRRHRQTRMERMRKLNRRGCRQA